MDHLCRSLLNTYTAQPLDRAAHGRKDPEWLAIQLANPDAQYLILDGHSVVTQSRVPVVLSRAQFLTLNSAVKPTLLGLKKTDGLPVFSVNLSEPIEVISSFSQGAIESLSLREFTREVDPDVAGMYSYAMLLNHWHITTRFCTRCGTALEIREGGSMQQCTNDSCKHIEFPRINPAVIMRVTKGDKILLARQASWPQYKYSVLAGFVEVGETLEHAVAREVMEEVNIVVENINYHSSQPWPFPNSFMLGYTAEASSDAFELEQDDIEHALWLTAEELKMNMLEGTVLPPPDLSISYSLINDWFEAETGMSLNEFKSSHGK